MNEPLTILYLLGTNQRSLWPEFRFSLRSIAKFGGENLRPCVIGHAPPWFLGDVYPGSDRYGAKEANMMGKILTAIDVGLVEGRFMVSSDDHFLTQPVDLRTMPIYWRSEQTRTSVPSSETNHYFYALAGTCRTLQAANFTTYNTSLHSNLWVDTQDLPDVEALFVRAMSDIDVARYGLNSYLVWPNIAITKRGVKHKFRQDIKMRGDLPLDQVKQIIQYNPIISTADDFFMFDDKVQLLRDLYPEKSPWEA